jgi:hypothetical protein
MRDAHADTSAGPGDDRDFVIQHTHGQCPLPLDPGVRKACDGKITCVIITGQ